MRKSTIIILILACVGCINAFAQQKPSYEYYRQWYLGKDGGIPFGMSTFSSFGEGPNKLGWSAGMYGGYHFNSFLSVEAFMLTGKVKQPTQKQFESFWLLRDGSCMLHEPE